MDEWEYELAGKRGISKDQYDYVKSILAGGKKVPQDYLEFISEKIRIARLRKKADILCMETLLFKPFAALHAKKGAKWADDLRDYQLEFLERKGKLFVDAWYICNQLEYLKRGMALDKIDKVYTLEDWFRLYKKNKQRTYSEEVDIFLRNNIDIIKRGLGV